MKKQKLTSKLLLVVALHAGFSPAVARAEVSADQALAETHVSARKQAKAMLLAHILQAVNGLKGSATFASGSRAESQFSQRYALLTAKIAELNDRADQAGQLEMETEILEQFGAAMDHIQLSYKEAIGERAKIQSDLSDLAQARMRFMSSMTSNTQTLTQLCRSGVAFTPQIGGFSNPVIRMQNDTIMVNYSSGSGGGAKVDFRTEGGDSAEADAAVTATLAALATVYPYGTIAAAVLWVGYTLFSSDAQNAKVRQKTNQLFNYYEKIARSDDIARYYKEACAPVVNTFQATESDVRTILNPNSDQKRLAVIRKKLRVLNATVGKTVAALANASKDPKKSTIENAPTLESIPMIYRYSFLKTAFEMRDDSFDPGRIDSADADQLLNLVFAKTRKLSQLEYRLHLMAQNPLLVRSMQLEIQSQKALSQLHQEYLSVLNRAISSEFMVERGVDVMISILALEERLVAAKSAFPQSIALSELFQRVQILKAFKGHNS